MENFTPEYLENHFSLLPLDLQSSIASVDTTDTIKQIGEKHHLHLDKIGELASEIGLVMMGLVKPRDFTLRLEKNLLIPSQLAVAITLDANEKLFAPIQDKLRALTEKREAGAENTDSEQAPGEGEGKKEETKENIFEKRLGGLFTAGPQQVDVKIQDPYREPVE